MLPTSIDKLFPCNIKRGIFGPTKELRLNNLLTVDIYHKLIQFLKLNKIVLFVRSFQFHQRNSVFSIFRGEFLGSNKSCNFDTSTHNRDNHALSNAYEIVPELIIFYGDIDT